MFCKLFNREALNPKLPLPQHVVQPVQESFDLLMGYLTQAQDCVSLYKAPPFNGDVDYLSDWEQRRDVLMRATDALREVLDGKR